MSSKLGNRGNIDLGRREFIGKIGNILTIPFAMTYFVTVTGCGAYIHKGATDAFRRYRDSDIGKPIQDCSVIYYPHDKKLIANGNTEYIFYYPASECRFAYEVDQESIVLSWRYISDPDLCYVQGDWWRPW